MCRIFMSWGKPVLWKYFPMLMLTSVVQWPCPWNWVYWHDVHVYNDVTRHPQRAKTWQPGKVCHHNIWEWFLCYLSVVRRALSQPGTSQTLGRGSLVWVISVHRCHDTVLKPLSVCLTFKAAWGWAASIRAVFLAHCDLVTASELRSE